MGAVLSDNSIIPLSDDQAKLISDLVGVGKDVGSYVAGVLGDLPKDLIKGLAGDRIKIWAFERATKQWSAAIKRLADEGIEPSIEPNLKIAVPILSAATAETREGLQDIWTRLLAASLHPDKSKQVRLKFSDALEKLDPVDARLLLALQARGTPIKCQWRWKS